MLVIDYFFIVQDLPLPLPEEEVSNTASHGIVENLPYSDFELVLARWREDVSW